MILLWRSQFLLQMIEGIDQEHALWTQELMRVRRRWICRVGNKVEIVLKLTALE